MHPLLEFLQLIFYLFYYYVEAVIRLFVPERPSKKSLCGKLVLVTGAGHGIGRELAIQFSELGARLVIWDINKENNDKVADEIREAGGSVTSYICDVSKINNIKDVASQVQREVGDIDVLVNNAGVLNGGALLKLSDSDIQRTMDINIMAYIWTCRQFLPSMINRNEGHIINVASMAAKGGTAYLTDYTASKFAVAGFTEALKDEMEREGHDGIHFTTVFPMFVDTGMTKYKRGRASEWLTPKEVAAAVVTGAQCNLTSVFIPPGIETQLKIVNYFPNKFITKLRAFGNNGIDPQYEEKKD